MTTINQKEYLKKYLGIGKAPGEKKKKKKRDKNLGNRLKVIDDDVDVIISQEIEEDIAAANEDAPQIVAVIDERPIALQIDEKTNSSLWKPLGQPSSVTSDSRTLKLNSFRLNKHSKSNSSSSRETTVKVKKEPSSENYMTHTNYERNQVTIMKIKQEDEDNNDTIPRRNKRDEDYSPPQKLDRDRSPSRNDRNYSSPHRKSGEDDTSPRRRNLDDNSPRRKSKKNDCSSRSSDNSPPRRRNGYDNSPIKKRDETNSPPRRKRKDEDSSPPRKRNKQYDSRPSKKNNEDNSPPRKICKQDDSSPPRRRDKEGGSSPRRKNLKDGRRNSDNSPPRRGNVGGSSPPRTKHKEDSSPPRRHQEDSSPPRRRHKGDMSPPRRSHKEVRPPSRNTNEENDSSPPRRRNGQDNSPLRRYRGDDRSPPRKNKKEGTREKKSRWNVDTSPDHGEKMKKTLDGKQAGLQNAKELVRESNLLRQKEDDLFKNLSAEVSGKNAATVIRGKKVKDFEEEAAKEKREKEMKEKYDRWGKGLKQVEDQQQRIEDQLHEMSKPLARYADDEDLEKFLKEQEREGDPMLNYIRKKKKKERVAAGIPEKPVYMGEFMPNRFGIPPGYRWDGVDRSNSYEKKWFQTQNSKKASLEDAFKWSTEDM